MSMLFLCPSLSVSIFMSQRRQWHPTPVLLPGKPHGRRSLVGCSPWGREESDTTATSLSLFIFMHWRRKWQPTPVFLPGESQGRGSLVGCCLWGRTESDTTEATQQHTYVYVCPCLLSMSVYSSIYIQTNIYVYIYRYSTDSATLENSITYFGTEVFQKKIL